MAVGLFGRHSPPVASGQQALSEQKWLVRLLHGVGLFANDVCQGGDSDWLCSKLVTQNLENSTIDLIQPQLINSKCSQSVSRGLHVYLGLLMDVRKVTNTPQ